MQENTNLDAILRRIEKLKNIANDSRANPNEAANAAIMAANLMRKYQLNESDVIVKRLLANEDLVEQVYVPRLSKSAELLSRVPKWASLLANYISKLTQTRAFISRSQTEKGLETCIKFCGYTPDVQMAVYLMEYLQTVVFNLRNEFKESKKYSKKGITSLNAFTDGLVIGIIEVLQTELKSQQETLLRKSADNRNKPSTEIMLSDTKKEVLDKKYGQARSKSASFNTSSGFNKGLDKGRAVSIRKPIEAPANASKTKLLK